DKVNASINAVHRSHIKRNHSATHLLHKALKLVLGDHVEQKGSLVDDTKTRFDFSHPKQISEIQINEIELIVNNEILKNQDTQIQIMPIDEAQKVGAMMLFGEKYNSEVRVLDIGNSRELCGGTHVSKTGDIGLFKIQTESSISAGIRRIEAVTGFNLINMVDQQKEILSKLAKDLNSGIQDLPSKIKQLLMQIKENEKNLNQLKSKVASNQGDNLINKAIIIKTFKFLAETVDNQGPNELREMIDKLKEKLKTAVIILAAVEDQKITFAVGVSDDLTNNIDAGAIAKTLGKETGGKGGGRRNMAMAGGSNPNLIPKALKKIKDNLSN
ncbi:MAG: DHHA1 domain-containing protein, partial [Methylophilaceae bacterium]